MNEASGVVRPEDIAARETEPLPSYQPLGELVADLHDRPERMLAKGVIRKIVPWPSRRYFYWRLRRRLREEELVQGMGARRRALARGGADAAPRLPPARFVGRRRQGLRAAGAAAVSITLPLLSPSRHTFSPGLPGTIPREMRLCASAL